MQMEVEWNTRNAFFVDKLNKYLVFSFILFVQK